MSRDFFEKKVKIFRKSWNFVRKITILSEKSCDFKRNKVEIIREKKSDFMRKEWTW